MQDGEQPLVELRAHFEAVLRARNVANGNLEATRRTQFDDGSRGKRAETAMQLAEVTPFARGGFAVFVGNLFDSAANRVAQHVRVFLRGQRYMHLFPEPLAAGGEVE